MSCFTDNSGKKHTLEVNVFTLSRLKREHSIDLTEAIGPNGQALLSRITGDVVTLLDVLASLLQLDEVQLEQLARNMDESTVEAAVTALVESILDFFPPAKRAPLQKAFRRSIQIVESQTAKALQRLDQMVDSPEFEAAISGQLTAGN